MIMTRNFLNDGALADKYNQFLTNSAQTSDSPSFSYINTANAINEGSTKANDFLEESSIEYKPNSTLSEINAIEVAPTQENNIEL